MSEEKVIHHAKKAMHVLQDKEKGWATKAKEFFWEIFIIVIAVSITLMLHNWNDHLHELRLEQDFLSGIKRDLDSGAVGVERNIRYFQPSLDYYINVRQLLATHRSNAAYLDTNSAALINTAYWVFDMGRFEGFKSSGYLRLIENQTLLKHLMTLYTVDIPFQVDADRVVYGARASYYDQYIGRKTTFDQNYLRSNQIAASKLVEDPDFRYYILKFYNDLQIRKLKKQELIGRMKKLSAEIGEELNK